MQCHRFIAVAALTVLGSFGAQAAGNHAGAHAHGHEHGHAPSAAIGQPGVAAQATRTVQVDMDDNMRFTPGRIDVKQGETVRFVVRNLGRIRHEMVLGTPEELRAHDELMKKHPGMEHEEPNQVTVAPGKTGELAWRFTRSGEVHFACLEPGHYDAGMKGTVRVAAAATKGTR